MVASHIPKGLSDVEIFKSSRKLRSEKRPCEQLEDFFEALPTKHFVYGLKTDSRNALER